MTTTQPAPPAPFTTEDFAARMRRVVADAARAELDGVLVTPGPDLVWLTGYQPTAITERLTVLVLAPDREPDAARADPGAAGRRGGRRGARRSRSSTGPTATDPYARAPRAAARPAAGTAISDSAWAMHLLGLQTRAARHRRYASLTDSLPMLRAVKDADELDRLAAGGRGRRRDVRARSSEVRFAGRQETEVAADLAGLLREYGHEQVDFTVVGSGPERRQPAPRGRRPGHRGRATRSSSTSAA